MAAHLEPLLAYSKEHGIITASWGCLSPLFRNNDGEGEIAPVCEKIVLALEDIAKARGTSVTPNQLLFKWLESKNIIAVTTSSKEWRMKEYIETEKVMDLTQGEIDAIERATGGTHYRFFVRLNSHIFNCSPRLIDCIAHRSRVVISMITRSRDGFQGTYFVLHI